MDCSLTINVGSATLKFAVFAANKSLMKICSGDIDNKKRKLSIYDKDHNLLRSTTVKGKENLLEPKILLKWIRTHYPDITVIIVSHRIVHGGKKFLKPTLITKSVVNKLKALIPLAPLHIPSEVSFIEKLLIKFPNIPQVACFDTSFHTTQSRLATLFAIPRKYINKGIVRYGFHGLSYEYIAHELSKYINKNKLTKVIVAHLGNGASLCAMHKLKSVATSMGFTALDGLMMGTRCGNIDPGILIHLIKEEGLSIDEVETLLYKESGLLGVSGVTADVRGLLQSKNPHAKEALDLFCYRAAREIGSLTSALDGLDVLVFTGGIGENATTIRSRICNHLKWLGVNLDSKRNKNKKNIISTDKSKIKCYIIPTNEELMLAKHALGFIMK